MDAISLITADHQAVEALFQKYESLGPRALKSKRRLVDQMIEALSVHAAIEELVLYPRLRQVDGGAGGDVLESLEEHHVMEVTLAELQHLGVTHERFDAKVTVLMENVRHHVEEEEDDVLPRLGEALDDDALEALGDELAEARTTAPTRPHPLAPQEPPANLVTAPAAAAVDRARDAGGDVVGRAVGLGERVVEQVRDLVGQVVEEVTGGGADALETARRQADEVVDRVEDTARDGARKARGAAEKTAEEAKGTAQKAARKAKGGAARTKSEAKGAAEKAGKTAEKAGKTAKGTAGKTAKKAQAKGKKAKA